MAHYIIFLIGLFVGVFFGMCILGFFYVASKEDKFREWQDRLSSKGYEADTAQYLLDGKL